MLADARRVVVLTGAGVSAESKIPTFRDAMEGLWASFDPQSLATPEGFAADPETVTRWYDFRRMKCREAEPNPGHLALARIERELESRSRDFILLTQNVDGLHRRAGNRSVVELHGSLEVWRCVETGQEFRDLPAPFDTYPPRTDRGTMLRPGVVWFGEMLPPEAIETAGERLDACDLFFSIGTSATVYPAAGFSDLARAAGAKTVEINPDATPASRHVDESVRARAGAVLPQIVELAFGAGNASPRGGNG